MDYSSHEDVLVKLKECQEAEADLRENAREAHVFLDKRDGQWEPHWWNACNGKPRYTFDMTSAIVDQIAGRMEKMDFDIKIRPGDGRTSKEDAKTFDGIVRTIENLSNAKHIYNKSGRNMVTGGIDGWMIVQQYADADSFDQDLIIKPVANFIDSVWFDTNAKAQDKSDAKCCFVLEAITREEYESRWPEASGMSVGNGRRVSTFTHKADQIIIGQVYYVEEKPRTIVQTNLGRVFDKDKLADVADELAANGEVIERERKRPRRVVYSRLFDGSDWLNEPQETVFSYVPVIPTYGNYKVFEEKNIYHGVVDKLIDAQRVFNYSKSREIEEGALAPRAKFWMTPAQAAGHETQLSTLNTNADPVQFYNADASAPPPAQTGGAQINPGLSAISQSMREIFSFSSGMFAANMGDNPQLQSGIAIEKLQDRGDTGTEKYIAAQEIAISHTAKILVDAIPKVYDAKREMLLIGEDGSVEPTTINTPVMDAQTGRIVMLNDLSRGQYSVNCTAGPSFKSRKSETVSAIVEVAAIDPSIVEVASDVLFNNMDAPGLDLVAKRKRRQLFMAGVIPPDQMTDKERQEAQAMQSQPKEPDAATLLAQAEVAKAQAQGQKVQVDAKLTQQRIQLEAAAAQRSVEADQFSAMLEQQRLMLDQQKAAIDAIKSQAEALKAIRDAMGVDAVVSPGAAEAYSAQTNQIRQAQLDAGM